MCNIKARRSLVVQQNRRSMFVAAERGSWTGEYTRRVALGAAPQPQLARPEVEPIDSPLLLIAKSRAARRRVKGESPC